MMFVRHFAELVQIQKPRKLVKMKHRLVLTMLAKKRDVLAEIHIFQIIRNVTTVAALHALAEFLDNFFVTFRHIAIVSETEKKCKRILEFRAACDRLLAKRFTICEQY